MKKLLFFVPLQLLAMEEDVIVYVAPELPETMTRESFITNDDIKRWAMMELDAREAGFNAKLKILQEKLDEHTKDNSTAHTKTRAALLATAITTICGVTTTLITYLTTHEYGSN